ncbi:hypothetical protein ACJX0J_032564, partial [Zea mays]
MQTMFWWFFFLFATFSMFLIDLLAAMNSNFHEPVMQWAILDIFLSNDVLIAGVIFLSIDNFPFSTFVY